MFIHFTGNNQIIVKKGKKKSLNMNCLNMNSSILEYQNKLKPVYKFQISKQIEKKVNGIINKCSNFDNNLQI